jgi:hypothetical protein
MSCECFGERERGLGGRRVRRLSVIETELEIDIIDSIYIAEEKKEVSTL